MVTEVAPYVTITEVRAKLGDDSSDFTDGQISAAIEFAMSLVTSRAGKTYGVITSQTVHDVRTDTVVLHTDGVITDVLIGIVSIPSSSLEIFPWGIRFKAPAGGAWFDPAQPLTVEPTRAWWSNGRGVTVTVVDTFGEEPGPLLKRAALLLTLDIFARRTRTRCSHPFLRT